MDFTGYMGMAELLIKLFLAGSSGQSLRAILGITDAIINEEEILRNRFINTMLLGGFSGMLISYLIIPYAFTDIGVYLAIFAGLSVAYLIENLYKILGK